MIPTPEKHPLPRDGTSQAARLPVALDPSRPLLDDRTFENLLVTAHRLADGLAYFDLDNRPAGSWQPFLDRQFPVELALLARRDSTALRQHLETAVADLDDDVEAVRDTAARNLAAQVDATLAAFVTWNTRFARTLFLPTLDRVVSQTLAPALKTWFSALNAQPASEQTPWPPTLSPRQAVSLWRLDPAVIPADPRLVAASPTDRLAGVRHRLVGLATAAVDGQTHLASEADAFLRSGSLADGSQPAHLALLLAALSQFRHVQAAHNDLVRRLLEFYYRALLQLRPLPPVPDRALVTFVPTHNVASSRLPAGTRLFAGKDASGVERHFALNRELIVNRASVLEQRSLFVDAPHDRSWRHALVAASADGLGAPLPKDQPAWHPFGHDTLPLGRRGFAVASSVLRLSGGTKSISLVLRLSQAASDDLDARCADAAARAGVASESARSWALEQVFSAALTGPKAWISLDTDQIQARFEPASREITLVLDPLGPELPIGRFDPAIHGRAFPTSEALLEITLLPADRIHPGDFLEGLTLEQITLSATVTGDANLVVVTDTGTVDVTKPFLPFGPAPTATNQTGRFGSSLYVGSAEIFGKTLTELAFDLTWKETPATTSGFAVRPHALIDTRWVRLGETDVDLFSSPLRVSASTLEALDPDPDLGPFTTLAPGLKRGFVRLALSQPATAFGHATYAKDYATAVVAAIAADNANPTLPAAPVAPVASSITANYTATATRVLGAEDDSGIEWHAVEPHGEWRSAVGTSSSDLVPAAPADAAFFVGLKDATAGSQVSLLAHLAEGSGDPLFAYPAITWEYLAGDTWHPFDSADLVFDGTLELRRTGVLVFALPSDATVDHSRMPAGRHWIRALAHGPTQSLNQAYTLTAQAAEATFVDQGNDLSRLGTPLSAGTITRLVQAVPGIKKVLHPLPSTDGLPAESGLPYYRRVSERLRHRRRAITLWDYERLVLERFPAIHKVKCIPHTAPDPYSELAPGHVTVVVIPRLTPTAFDPQRPAASQELRKQIEDFLATRISAQVELHVINPAFEEIQVIASLAFRDGYDHGFYLTQAAADLDTFLAPWTLGDAHRDALAFGRELYPSSILNFLEERDYVDFVDDFRARQFVDGLPRSPDPAILEPTRERALLVPHRQHQLRLA